MNSRWWRPTFACKVERLGDPSACGGARVHVPSPSAVASVFSSFPILGHHRKIYLQIVYLVFLRVKMQPLTSSGCSGLVNAWVTEGGDGGMAVLMGEQLIYSSSMLYDIKRALRECLG